MVHGGKRQKSSYGTVLKYDGLYRTEEEEESVFRSRSFRSSKAKRFEFGQQDKKHFQDDEDLLSELAHLKLVSNYKDLTAGLDLHLREFEEDTLNNNNNTLKASINKKPTKKKKVKLKYHYEDEMEDEVPELEIKLKSVDSKLKYQKFLPKSTITASKQPLDPIYKKFIKRVQPSKEMIVREIPEDFVSRFKLIHWSTAPLSKHAATSLLQSRFTNSSNNNPQQPLKVSANPSGRIVHKIKVAEILRKRLGI